MRQLPPFPLSDVAYLPGGEQVRGARARVYHLLLETAVTGYRHKIGEELGPAGWVPDFLLILPSIGGSEGKRRARDLRQRGVAVEIQRYQGTNTHLYGVTGTSQALPLPAPKEAGAKGVPKAFAFWTATAPKPVGPNPICVSPASPTNGDRHWLAPKVGAEESEHLVALREAWCDGAFEELFKQRSREVTFWAHPHAGYDPLQTIAATVRRAGTHLGIDVDYLGTWQWREGR